MKLRAVLFVAVLAVGIINAQKPEQPKMPEPGEDKVLLKGKPAKDFFGERLSDPAGAAKVAAASKAYKDEAAALKKLIDDQAAANVIDDQESKVEGARFRLLEVVEKHGRCATNEVVHTKIETAGRTENWYTMDGSCLLEGTTKEELEKAFRNAIQLFLGFPEHPKRFRRVLVYVPVDHETGMIPDLKMIKDSPFYSYMAYNGAELFGTASAYAAYTKNEFSAIQPNMQDFVLRTTTARSPREFAAPRAQYFRASGRESPVVTQRIAQMRSMIYATPQGYFRMWVALDLSADVSLIKTIARERILDVLLQVVELTAPGK